MAGPSNPKWHVRAPRYRREEEARGGQRRTGAYIWRIAPRDIPRTRSDHLRLNGQKFRWDDPPVVNLRTGERGHPGHDPRCRCYAEPVPDEE